MNLNNIFPSNVSFLTEVQDDFLEIDRGVIPQIVKAIRKVAKNPLPDYEGGYGDPLRKTNETDLHGFNKIKFKKVGIRVVYKCLYEQDPIGMKIIIVSVRAENKVYYEAERRIEKYGLRQD